MFIKLLSDAKAWWMAAIMVSIVMVGAAGNSAHGLGAAEKAKDRAVKFGSIKKVIAKWNPDQHLYVHGDIGVGKAQLAELEQWLDANAAHWTVVLMSDAEDQHFTHADCRQFTGMDAVEYALGSGLSNRTDFGKLEHPVTHQADGTVFVLFLKERKLSYFASAAQDCHSLGEAHWTGQLDQPAVRAMRSGGRVLDAVKETVKSVNCKLEEAIEAEKSSGG
ncbi:MAG: hypothetical protein ACTHK7_02825 [Aureliella sp.]